MLRSLVDPSKDEGSDWRPSILCEICACKHFDKKIIYNVDNSIQHETPIREAPEQGNNQPHLVVFNHDEYNQYFISIKQKLCMECTDVAIAIFHLLGSHYILNLIYHPKLNDLMRFIQEKTAHISSSHGVKSKSAVTTTH